MKMLKRQSVICEGQFNGADIEPGTFHTFIIQNNAGPDKDGVPGGTEEMPDLDDESKDQATALDPENVTCY